MDYKIKCKNLLTGEVSILGEFTHEKQAREALPAFQAKGNSIEYIYLDDMPWLSVGSEDKAYRINYDFLKN